MAALFSTIELGQLLLPLDLEELLTAHRKEFEKLVAELSFFTRYTLLACAADGRVLKLRGCPQADGSFPEFDAARLLQAPQPERVLLIRDAEEAAALDLFPARPNPAPLTTRLTRGICCSSSLDYRRGRSGFHQRAGLWRLLRGLTGCSQFESIDCSGGCQQVHIISKKKLRGFWERHADARQPLEDWWRITRAAQWNHLAETRRDFPHADPVGTCTVFNVGGNKYRLITKLYYLNQVVLVRFVLTHPEYHRGGWKNDCA